SSRTSTGSTNDLKPRSLTAFRCTPKDPSDRRGRRRGAFSRGWGNRRVPPAELALDRRRSGIGPHDDRVGDLDDLVRREECPRGVLADRLRARRLVDTDRADGAAALVEDVATDPADVVRHLLVAHLARTLGRLAELFPRTPTAAPQDDVRVHVDLLRWDPIAQAAQSERATAASPSFASIDSACRAASCSASFFDEPRPTPASSPSLMAAAVNVRSCG